MNEKLHALQWHGSCACHRRQEMKITDFIEIVGDHNDSNFEISGVFGCGGAPEISYDRAPNGWIALILSIEEYRRTA